MSKDLKEGSKAPEFDGIYESGKSIKLSSLHGRKVILYFYPKDDTPGCTKESCEFSENYQELLQKDTAIIGVSRDSIASHKKFKQKYNLSFPLISDESGTICESYGVWKEKKNYGKTYMGIERSTFLINQEGKIQKIWRNVKVNGHVEAVINEISEI